MMITIKRTIVSLLVCILVVGGASCGPKSIDVAPPDIGPAEAIKKDLQSVASSGSLGSEMRSIEQNLEKMKSTDAAKADALRKDLEALYKTTGADQIKSKANAMIKKL